MQFPVATPIIATRFTTKTRYKTEKYLFLVQNPGEFESRYSNPQWGQTSME
jgi:hypothetical protein